MRKLMLVAAAATALWMPLGGRTAETPLETAGFAWDRGDYIGALTAYLPILAGPADRTALRTMGLRTGEVFQEVDLPRGGGSPTFSPDGRLLSYETGALPNRTIHLVSPDERYDMLYLSNYAYLQVKDELARITGVGSAQVFGAGEYSMRVGLDPDRLSALQLTATDVVRAIREQNVQVAAGRIGDAPAREGQADQISGAAARRPRG